MIVIFSITASAIIIIFIAELLFVLFSGSAVPAPIIPRDPLSLGSGKPLTYVVMGDSTSISQGSNYDKGYALASARHLALHYKVTFVNTGISGATTKTVLDDQLKKAVSYKPDVVLVAVGANDATKFTGSNSVKDSAQKIIDGLKQVNPNVHIIMTRSPAMDSVTRFPFISKWVMGLRTKQVNAAFATIIEKNHVTLAPIAEKTRAAFLADPSLTAPDKFHPNARGYALWTPVIIGAVDEALKSE